jgi:hypothetical protein
LTKGERGRGRGRGRTSTIALLHGWFFVVLRAQEKKYVFEVSVSLHVTVSSTIGIIDAGITIFIIYTIDN